jgi:hypothetical protein
MSLHHRPAVRTVEMNGKVFVPMISETQPQISKSRPILVYRRTTALQLQPQLIRRYLEFD